MRIAAIVFGALGGAAAVVAVLTVCGVMAVVAAGLTGNFWFMVSGILLLSSIAFAVARSRGEE
jgi:hypothetical protein